MYAQSVKHDEPRQAIDPATPAIGDLVKLLFRMRARIAGWA
jgi:hypothetical protein